ncbi:pilus assembly PilX family protein [Thiolapillus sp.]
MTQSMPKKLSQAPREQGAALIVSLLLLTVITLLSLTAMRSAHIDTKIAVNHQQKQLAFQAAENAFAKLTSLPPDEMKDLDVPGTLNATSNNADFVPVDSDTHTSADLEMKLTDISRPGQYKFSGFGLNIVTVVFQADAFGEVSNTNARAHNRMEVALVRE